MGKLFPQVTLVGLFAVKPDWVAIMREYPPTLVPTEKALQVPVLAVRMLSAPENSSHAPETGTASVGVDSFHSKSEQRCEPANSASQRAFIERRPI